MIGESAIRLRDTLESVTSDKPEIVAGQEHALDLAVALGLVSIALITSLLLRPWPQFPDWFPFLIAGIASAWIRGRTAGWISVVLSTLACDYFLAAPLFSLAVDRAELPHFIAFAITMVLGNWFGSWRKKAEGSIRHAREQSELRAGARDEELEKVSEALRAEVTSREQAEHEREIAELRWKAVLDSSVIGIALADETGTVMSFNFRFAQLFSDLTINPRGHSLFSILGKSSPTVFIERYHELLGGTRDRIELEIPQGPDGDKIGWTRVQVAVVPGTPAFSRFFVVFCDDISAHKGAAEDLIEARAQLAHASRLTMIGELTASIAHEINQPLSAVITNSNACMRWLSGDRPNLPEATNTLGWIVRDAKRAADVIARIRGLMRREDGRFHPLSVNDVVQECLELMQQELRRQKVRVNAKLEPTLPSILGERIHLQQVFLNLIINAIEAMAGVDDRIRELTVRTEQWPGDGPGVMIEIGDNGIGVAPGDTGKLFEAFFTTKRDGTGMGLWISRSVIENHSGELVPIPGDGFGMRFRIRLPCEPRHAHDTRLIAGEDFL